MSINADPFLFVYFLFISTPQGARLKSIKHVRMLVQVNKMKMVQK